MKFIEARHYTPVKSRNIRVLVIHDMEAPEKGTTAEAVARYFANNPNKTSAHYCVDNDSEVACVPDMSVAYAAPGCNNDGLHFELAGYASQKRADWADEYSTAMLKRAAKLVAAKAKQYGIPIKKLSVSELRNKSNKGIVGHADVSDAFHQTTHRDPGPNFPWDDFISMVKAERDALDGKTESKPNTQAGELDAPKFPLPKGHWYGTESKNPKNHSGYYKSDQAGIQRFQSQMRRRGWTEMPVSGVFDDVTEKVVKQFQREKHLAVDGCVGSETWDRMWESKVTN